MKIVKRILIVIAILIAIPLIMAIFISKDFAVEREVTINKPKEQVFNYVKMLKNQNEYSKWAMMEPGMAKEFRGTDGTVGFVSAWEGKKVGKGEQEIKAIQEGQNIDYEIRFKKPFESTAQSHMSTEAVGGTQTKVKWGFAGRSPYPWNFMNLFMGGSVGKDLQTGLNNLKALLEKQP
jgi:uncharacterized protein YndB with AHSA1/START domain